MLHESPTLDVATCDGVATLRLRGPALPEVAAAVQIIAATAGLDLLVVRGHFAPPWFGDPLGFAVSGQRLTRAVADLPLVTVAFVEGPCRGPALELALACDHRLAVAGPDSWAGFPTPPCWGGSARAPRLPGDVTAREGVRLGLFDDACSARRGGIELQLLIDRQLRRPRKRPAPPNLDECEAAERRTATLPAPSPHRAAVPASVGLVGPGLGDLAGELAARGARVCGDTAGADMALAVGLRRGRWTPLEFEQAWQRLAVADPHAADWTVSSVGAVASRPGRLVTLPAADGPSWLRP